MEGKEGKTVGNSFCRAILALPSILVSGEQISRGRRLLDTQKDGHFHRATGRYNTGMVSCLKTTKQSAISPKILMYAGSTKSLVTVK